MVSGWDKTPGPGNDYNLGFTTLDVIKSVVVMTVVLGGICALMIWAGW